MDPERRGRPVLHLLLRVRLALILRWLVVPEVLLTPEERKVRQGGRRRVRRLGCSAARARRAGQPRGGVPVTEGEHPCPGRGSRGGARLVRDPLLYGRGDELSLAVKRVLEAGAGGVRLRGRGPR